MTIHLAVNLAQVLAICFVIALAVAVISVLGGLVVFLHIDAPRPIVQTLLIFGIMCVAAIAAYVAINAILGSA